MPVLHLRDSGSPADSLALMKFWLIVTGIYFWEVVTSLYYEWNVIRGRQSYQCTIWIYSLSRLATLMVVVLNLVSFTVTSPLNCQAMVTSTWTFALLALGASSLLIVLRIVAIWNSNKVIVGIAAGVWGVNFALLLAGAVRIRAVWSPVTMACQMINVETNKLSISSLLVTDIFLLLIMLAGLLRFRRGRGGSLDLWRFLWKQGFIWFAIATFADIPQLVFLILNLNDAFDLMFLMPSLIAMTIAATRIYRSVSHFASPPSTAIGSESGNTSESRQRSSRFVSTNKDTAVVHIPSDRLEVSVHTAYEEHPISKLADKPHELGFEDNTDTEDREGEKMSTLSSVVGAAV
ncbi:hypothetical protein F5888DRAFT_105780 [Russula emetica]|nr:hypothetical protein F5888DRAFT_105780 [Russula emetica]